MKIVILLYPGLTVLDAIGPYEILGQLPKTEILFVAKEKGNIKADTGFLELVASHSISDIDQCDILLIPGGGGSKNVRKDQTILDWIRKIHPTTHYTTSVCNGSLILGAAGLLKGSTATTYWADEKRLQLYGATYRNERWVQEGKIITAAGVSAGIDMALMLVAKFAGDDMAKMIQLGVEYDPQPPFDCGSVKKSDPAHVALLIKHHEAGASDVS